MAIEIKPKKVCKKCGGIEWLSTINRHGNPSFRCNSCKKAYSNTRYKIDPEYRSKVLVSNSRYRASIEYFRAWRASLTPEKRRAYNKVRNETQRKRRETDLQLKARLQEYYRQRSQREAKSLDIRYLKNLVTRWHPINFKNVNFSSTDIQQYQTYLTLKRQLNATNI